MARLEAVAIFQSFNLLFPPKQPDDDALSQGSGGRVLDRVATHFIDDLENGVQRFPSFLLLRPAGQGLSHRVQEGGAAVGVGGDDRIANAGERDLQPLPLLVQPRTGSRRVGERDRFSYTLERIDVLSNLSKDKWNMDE